MSGLARRVRATAPNGAPETADPLPALQALAARIRFTPSGGLVIDGRPVAPVRGGDRRTALLESLAVAMYERVYTGAEAAPPLPLRDLTADLARANATPDRWEHDWTFGEAAPNGSVIGLRFGRQRRFRAGEFIVAPAAAGEAPRLSVHLAGGSATRQPGFYHCFGDAFRDSNDQGSIVRLYFHARVEAAVPLVAGLTALLNRYRVPFVLKTLTQGADFARSDNTVLYVARDVVHAVAAILAAVRSDVAPCLSDPVPLMTLRLANGIGLAEDPGAGESFGTSRCRLAARAMLVARRGETIDAQRLPDCFDEAVAAAGLSRDALHLNAGADDIYGLIPAMFVGDVA